MTGKQAWQDVQLTYEGPRTWIAFKGFWENFLTLKDNVEDATDDEAYHILIKQIPEFLRKQVVEHQSRTLAERNRLSLIGIAKLSEISLRNWLADLHISVQQAKILDDEVGVDVNREYQLLTVMALNGCALGSSSREKLRVKMLPKPKHLDTGELVSKVKELLQIEEHSKEFCGVIRNPEPTHKPSWSGAQRHARRVDFSEDEEEENFWSSLSGK